MKAKIHPKYIDCTVTCGCGEEFTTRSTKPNLKVEICSSCHPFYTGKQKFVDTAGRVEKFQKKFKWDGEKAVSAMKQKKVKAPKAVQPQILARPKKDKKKKEKRGAAGKKQEKRAAEEKAEKPPEAKPETKPEAKKNDGPASVSDKF